MPDTFVDPAHEERYAQQGYVVAPLLSAAEVEQVRAAYHELVPGDDHGLTIDYMRPDRSAMREIAALMDPIWEQRLPDLFVDHLAVFTTFVTKHPGEASAMFLHEDRTFVDERVARAGTLWVPLVDVGPGLDNGGLEVIPGSHRLCETWSGTGTPELFRPYERWLRGRLEPVAVEAGSALYYDTRTLHASAPNRSSAPREVVVAAIARRDAELLHVVATGRRHRRLHRVDREFYLAVHPHAVEDHLDEARYPVVEELDDDRRLGPQDFARVLGGDPPTADPQRDAAVAGLHPEPRRTPLLHEDPSPSAIDADRSVDGVHLEVEHGAAGLVDAAGDAPGGGVAVLRPGARVRLRLDGPGPWRCEVLDAAPAASTLEVDGTSVLLDEEVALRLPTDRELVIEHRGPGDLLLELGPPSVGAGAPARARSGLLRRLGRR